MKDSQKQKKWQILWWAVFFLALINCFVNLGKFEVEIWDESRHALNAYEMMKSGSLIAMTYDGSLDYWNLKPPLGAWLIIMGYKLLGVNLWGLRFFSALSAFLTILLTMSIAKTYGKNVSITAGAILTTMYSFLAFHTGRYGDYDALLAFFVAVTAWGLLKWDNNHRWGLWVASLMVSLSFLLKSFAAIIPFLMIGVTIATEKRYKKLTILDSIFSLLLMGVPPLIWAIARYQVDGLAFFQHMIGYDLLKRSQQAIEGHPESNLHYLEPIFFKTLPWSLLLFFVVPFLGFGISLKRKEKLWEIHARHSGFGPSLFWIWLIVPLFVAFLVKTKSDWYLNPFYPPLAIFIAWHIWNGKTSQQWVKKLLNKKKKLLIGMTLTAEILFALLVLFPSEWVFDTKIRYYPGYQRLLQEFATNTQRSSEGVVYTADFIEQDFRFLVKAMIGYELKGIESIREASPGMKVIVCSQNRRADIEKMYPDIRLRQLAENRGWVLLTVEETNPESL